MMNLIREATGSNVSLDEAKKAIWHFSREAEQARDMLGIKEHWRTITERTDVTTSPLYKKVSEMKAEWISLCEELQILQVEALEKEQDKEKRKNETSNDRSRD